VYECNFAEDERNPADLIVFDAGSKQPHDFHPFSAEGFENAWRLGCCAFLLGREAALQFVPFGCGTMIFSGASGSVRKHRRFASFAAAKAELRGVAQAMAREFGSLGLHVAHVIDGGSDGSRLQSHCRERRQQAGPDGLLNIDAIAEAHRQIHRQHRPTWTHEFDLRRVVLCAHFDRFNNSIAERSPT
jgi:NAD(P)-dependent dehydrogenase (short-subunit alcohol dehydrogenase family)